MDKLIGYQEPRFELVPQTAVDYSYAGVIDELFKAYAITLDPWQVSTLHQWLALTEDGEWAAEMCGLSVPRQNGKSKLIEARCIFGLVFLGESVLLTAHEAATAREIFGRIVEVFESSSDLMSQVKAIKKSNGHESIIMNNGGRLKATTRTPNAGRGLSIDLLVLDEAYNIVEGAMESLLPTISSSRLNAQIIYTSSPPSPEDNSDAFLRLRASALSSTPNPALSWREWSAHEGQEADFDSPEVWAQANPAFNMRTLKESKITNERVQFSDIEFARERLGLYADESKTQLFPNDLWTACRDESIYDLTSLVLAIDVKPDRSYGSISIAGERPDGLYHIEVVDEGQGIGWIVPRVVEICKRQGIKTVVVDYKSPASTLTELLKANKLNVFIPTVNESIAACATFYDFIYERKLIHRGQGLLDASVRSASKRKVGDGWMWKSRDGGDITHLVSTTLALFGSISTKTKKSKSNKSTSHRKAMILK